MGNEEFVLYFRKEPQVDLSELKHEPFREIQKVKEFSCGEKDLDDFLRTDEVKEFHEKIIGTTQLVFYKGDLVAYYTLSSEGLRTEKLKKHKKFNQDPFLSVNYIPGITICRFAVDERWQKKGIGQILLEGILVDAVQDNTFAKRLAIVQAKEPAIPFYQKAGFILVEHKSEEKLYRKIGTRTLYFDLAALK